MCARTHAGEKNMTLVTEKLHGKWVLHEKKIQVTPDEGELWMIQDSCVWG